MIRLSKNVLSFFSPRYYTQSLRGELENLVNKNALVVFIKGTPKAPMCGFSRAVCELIGLYGVEKSMVAVNVLENPKIREEIKLMTEWPTIPQVFVGGTFVGGCDIMFEMNRNGDLEKLLRKHKLIETE